MSPAAAPTRLRPTGRSLLFAAALLVAGALGLAPATALAAERLPEDAMVAGVPVGGLGPVGAERELRRVVGGAYERPVVLRAPGRQRTLTTAEAGLAIDYATMIRKAFELADRGRPVRVPLERSISGRRVTAAVKGFARPFRRPARSARVRFGVTRVVRIRHRFGRALDGGELRRDLLEELRAPTPDRVVEAGLRRVRPAVTLGELARRHHTFISIDRDTFTLRLFKRLRLVRSYGVAVGAGGYATPAGLHRILSKQVNPAWHAPNRPWAGAFAGKVIPAGDPRNPLKARFLAIGNGIGIHGTAQEYSIGSRASHGCIRMRVREVKLLYARVPVGTPVLIR